MKIQDFVTYLQTLPPTTEVMIYNSYYNGFGEVGNYEPIRKEDLFYDKEASQLLLE